MDPRGLRLARLRALPALMTRAPLWFTVPVGLALIILGLLISTRPLTSLWLLAVYAGISCVVSGIAEVVRAATRPRLWTLAIGTAWVLVGVAILSWLGDSIAVLPVVLAAVLVLGGLGEVPQVFRGRPSERALAAALALVQIVFGILAVTWPDLTLVTVAILFGVRTTVFGTLLVWRAVRRTARPSVGTTEPVRRYADAGRWAGAVLVLVLTAGTWWASTSLREGLPVIDSFYATPDAVPGQPGALLRSAPWPGEPPPGASVQRILYTTTDANDHSAVASAIVIVPDALPAGPRPVILWDHGTTGIARACAPSLMLDMFQIQGIPSVEAAITNGWVVVATDYSGQGAEGDFPYLVGEGEARSTLDSMRAARALDNLDLSDEAVVWGHSQGGHAALWTGAVAHDYAPEIQLVGVAAISPAADPKGLADRITSGAPNALTSLVTAWVLIPYSQTYPDVVFDEQVTPTGRAIVREMSARCTSQPGLLVSVLTSLGISGNDDLYVGDLTGGELGARLEQNKTLGPWSMPLLVAWGDADEVIAPELQEGYVAELCEAGTDFTWHAYPGYSHMAIVEADSAFLPVLESWTSSVLAGQPAPAASC